MTAGDLCRNLARVSTEDMIAAVQHYFSVPRHERARDLETLLVVSVLVQELKVRAAATAMKNVVPAAPMPRK